MILPTRRDIIYKKPVVIFVKYAQLQQIIVLVAQKKHYILGLLHVAKTIATLYSKDIEMQEQLYCRKIWCCIT